MKAPFYLNKNKEPLAFLLSSLCTHPFEVNGKEKIVLPQGSPTSPTITNVLCYELDKHLFQLAKKYNAKYSRYADDITFSCDSNIFKSDNRELSFIKKFHLSLKNYSSKDCA